jgi:N-acetylglucosamine malate deacetylase 1
MKSRNIMSNILAVAPHPDDETLGCGGAILKHKSKGDKIHWLIVTAMTEDIGYTPEKIMHRSIEIQKVSKAYGFSSVHQCGFPATLLDAIPLAEIVPKIGAVIKKVKPNIIYLPFFGDVHSDHRIVFDAVASCLKWFRYPSVKRVLVYEALSETDAALNPDTNVFHPNVFIDISAFLKKKMEVMRIYDGQLGSFPFPRSKEAICALAYVRGAASGFKAAEAFMLLKEIIG